MAATDTFANSARREDSVGSAVAVTPHDTTTLSTVTRALYVGGAGNLSLLMQDGTTVTLVGVPAGSMLPIRVSRVNSTSTTATSIVAFS